MPTGIPEAQPLIQSQTEADIAALKHSAADTAKKAAGVLHHQFEKHPNARAAASTGYLAGMGYLGHMICCLGPLASVPLAMIGFDLVHKGVKKASGTSLKMPVVEKMGDDKLAPREDLGLEAPAAATTPVQSNEDASCYRDMPYTELNVNNCVAARKGEEVSCADIVTGPIGYGLGKIAGLFSARDKANAAATLDAASNSAANAVVTSAFKPGK